MNFETIIIVGLILSVNFLHIGGQSYLLNCSAYSQTTKNATIRRLGWSARLHACFDDNPYDLTQPPIPFGFPSITIMYDYSVIYVISFEGSKISLMGQLVMGLVDFYRMWDIDQIPIGQIQLPLSEIWYPQVRFISSITKRSLKLLEPDDQALFFPFFVSIFRPNVVEGHCNVDYYRFPFDSQNCFLEFEFERYFFYQQDVYLIRMNYTYQFENFINEEWSLVNVVSLPVNVSFKEINVNSSGYSTNVLNQEVKTAKVGFQVNLTLHRYPQFYIVNVLVPIVVLTVIGQTAFAIPEHADGKIVVPLTVLLGFMFVQGIVANELPRSEQASSIGIYVLTCILLSSANVLCCAMCMWIAHMTHPMPRWLHVALVVGLGTCVFPYQWFIRLYKCFRHKSSAFQPNNENVEVFTTTQSVLPSSLPERQFTIPRATLTNEQNSNGISVSNQVAPAQTLAKSAGGPNESIAHKDLKENLYSSVRVFEDTTINKEWVLVAEVFNRVFGLLHIAALLACFFVYVFPLILDYYNNNYD